MQPVRSIGIETEQRNDGRMVQLGGEFCLDDEFLHARRPGEMLFLQGFDDHFAAEDQVSGEKDPAESALCDHFQDLITFPGVFQLMPEFRRGVGFQVGRVDHPGISVNDVTGVCARLAGRCVFLRIAHDHGGFQVFNVFFVFSNIHQDNFLRIFLNNVP